ncbi:hypothetical protein CCYA_CCYA05G1680 [Cyanidiococcus yangmingshanensis]|nr:hypothetical protein CCYA_CCYA05G1680 [Cyanidiococcus yangmingshanensis]
MSMDRKHSSTGITSLKKSVEDEFASLFHDGDVEAARAELNESVRDLIIWERNTVWRDMLLQERRLRDTHAKRSGLRDSTFRAFRVVPFLIAVVLFVGVLLAPASQFAFLEQARNTGATHDHSVAAAARDGAAQRCLALVTFASVLWATEAVPLFVTSLAIPLLTVVLRVFLDEKGERVLGATEAAHKAITSMSSPVLLLILGGYSISGALSKHTIDKAIAIAVLRHARRPPELLLMLMLLAVFLSMLVSNVAAPVLLVGIVTPVLQSFPPGTPFVKCALLGIAAACNIGGMTSPIASPQNAIALDALRGVASVSFRQWVALALPLALVAVFVMHAYLLVRFGRGPIQAFPLVPMHRPLKWKDTGMAHLVVILTVLVTIALWTSKSVSERLGGDGIVALVPVVVFMGTGLLSKEDFNSLPFNVIYLVSGGVVMGAAVRSSRLLEIVAASVRSSVQDASLWKVYMTFMLMTLLVACLMSHTVSSIILSPILAELGAGLGHPRLMVLGGALACSCAMALPVSSFPNMAVISVEDELGNPYLSAQDFVWVGFPLTLLSAAILASLGYGLLRYTGM